MFKLPSYMIDFDEDYMSEIGDKYYNGKKQLKKETDSHKKEDLIREIQLYENMRVIYQFDKAFFYAIEYVKSTMCGNENILNMFNSIITGKKINIEKVPDDQIENLVYIIDHLSKALAVFMSDFREDLKRAERRNQRLEDMYKD